MRKVLTYIDLFAGCGGLSLGLKNAGWKGLFAIESSQDAFDTLNYNLIQHKHFRWTKWLPKSTHNISEFVDRYEANLKRLRGKVDMVAGAPPCQGYSIAGKRDESDSRNDLTVDFIKVVDYVRPKVVLFENVPGFVYPFEKYGSNKSSSHELLIDSLRDLGYNIEYDIVKMSDYGIAQARTRYILIAYKNNNAGKSCFLQLKKNSKDFLRSKGLPLKPNLSNAIGDLLKGNGVKKSTEGQTLLTGKYGNVTSKYQKYLRKCVRVKYPNSHRFSNHKKQTIEKYAYLIDNAVYNKTITSTTRDKYKIKKLTIITLAHHLPAPTLTTQPSDYLHYKEPRWLTVREFARIQSFPDNYHFKGVYTIGKKTCAFNTSRYAQVANAIPPLFAEQLGLVIKASLGK